MDLTNLSALAQDLACSGFGSDSGIILSDYLSRLDINDHSSVSSMRRSELDSHDLSSSSDSQE